MGGFAAQKERNWRGSPRQTAPPECLQRKNPSNCWGSHRRKGVIRGVALGVHLGDAHALRTTTHRHHLLYPGRLLLVNNHTYNIPNPQSFVKGDFWFYTSKNVSVQRGNRRPPQNNFPLIALENTFLHTPNAPHCHPDRRAPPANRAKQSRRPRRTKGRISAVAAMKRSWQILSFTPFRTACRGVLFGWIRRMGGRLGQDDMVSAWRRCSSR